ncbi:MAG TPA: hypothetical protein VLF15_03950, partial [Pseudoxanthomonas sp.]|nr:hypothetical protein [Pseudoxanthomonas sp.]
SQAMQARCRNGSSRPSIGLIIGTRQADVGTEHVGVKQVGVKQVGAEQVGAEHVGAEQVGAEHENPDGVDLA